MSGQTSGGQGTRGGGQGGDPGPEIVEGADEGARLGSLEEQTPGLDTEQEEQTLRDARTFFEGQGGEGGQGGPTGALGQGPSSGNPS